MIEITGMHETLFIGVLVIIILLFLSAFFSGSETALTAASDARLHQLSLQGNRRASIVLRLRRQNETLIGAILIGNNITKHSCICTGNKYFDIFI
jgi:Mg2+/Co2+ transporter CorB